MIFYKIYCQSLMFLHRIPSSVKRCLLATYPISSIYRHYPQTKIRAKSKVIEMKLITSMNPKNMKHRGRKASVELSQAVIQFKRVRFSSNWSNIGNQFYKLVALSGNSCVGWRNADWLGRVQSRAVPLPGR